MDAVRYIVRPGRIMKPSCWILCLFTLVVPLSPVLAQVPNTYLVDGAKTTRVDINAVAEKVQRFSTVFSAVTVKLRGKQDPETFKTRLLATHSLLNCTFSEPNMDAETVDSILAKTDREAFDELQNGLQGIRSDQIEKAYQTALPGRWLTGNPCSPGLRRAVYILPHTAIEILWYEEPKVKSKKIEDVVGRIREASHNFEQVDLVEIGTGKFRNVEDLFDKRYWDCGFNIVSTDSATVDRILQKTDFHAFHVLQKELEAGLDVQERILGFGKREEICGTGNRLMAYVLPGGRVIAFHWYTSALPAPRLPKSSPKADPPLHEEGALVSLP